MTDLRATVRSASAAHPGGRHAGGLRATTSVAASGAVHDGEEVTVAAAEDFVRSCRTMAIELQRPAEGPSSGTPLSDHASTVAGSTPPGLPPHAHPRDDALRGCSRSRTAPWPPISAGRSETSGRPAEAGRTGDVVDDPQHRRDDDLRLGGVESGFDVAEYVRRSVRYSHWARRAACAPPRFPLRHSTRQGPRTCRPHRPAHRPGRRCLVRHRRQRRDRGRCADRPAQRIVGGVPATRLKLTMPEPGEAAQLHAVQKP